MLYKLKKKITGPRTDFSSKEYKFYAKCIFCVNIEKKVLENYFVYFKIRLFDEEKEMMK